VHVKITCDGAWPWHNDAKQQDMVGVSHIDIHSHNVMLNINIPTYNGRCGGGKAITPPFPTGPHSSCINNKKNSEEKGHVPKIPLTTNM